MRTLLACLTVLLLLPGLYLPAAGCTLVDHDWKPVVCFTMNLKAPLDLLGSLSWLVRHLPAAPRHVWFRTNDPGGVWKAAMVRSVIGDWTASATWHLLTPDADILATIRNLGSDRNASPALFVGVDQPRLWIGWFRDANSGGLCHQILIAQESRVRAILTGTTAPWAEEKVVHGWVSGVFFGLPAPQNLLSFTMTADGENPLVKIEDIAQVALLVSNRRLKQRVPKDRENPPALSEIPLPPSPATAK